ncbi:MAG: malate dehydrogenase (quinone) [Bacteroidetes bacterium]|nr:malate dehydrogenase (quinone) [Bacteroidota bacterium]MBS1540696.1 malate dehydrogenase (quinone) [Bacteroidota bacterium]
MSKAVRPLVPETDIVLIGAGIMSATLGIMLKELNPNFTIQIFERLDKPGLESSDAWNNAGTGHSAFCELNYTPPQADGTVDVTKALKICESFELSKEFWSHLVENKYLSDPSAFISRVPHMSFVWGDENVNFLRTRQKQLQTSALFSEMAFSDDPLQIGKWAPLVMEGRAKEPVAATRMEMGTDVNFGELTRSIFRQLEKMPGVVVHYDVETLDIDPHQKGGWDVIVRNLLNEEKKHCRAAQFVFLGAGGATLNLLKKAEIEERKGYGGFPVSGLWLKCNNEEQIQKHFAKVYGKARVGSPPMSVPHIDTRHINGKKELLFGPFAGFSTKFLKEGSRFDLAKSIKPDNFLPMISAGIHNLPLTKYLIDQVRLSHEDRMNALREYVPRAQSEEWELKEAGQRVQVIKKDHGMHGVLEFGTEAVVSADGSVAALLGASPGASTAAAIMFGILPRCFKKECNTPAWKNKMKEMAPSFGMSLATDAAALQASRQRTTKALNL